MTFCPKIPSEVTDRFFHAVKNAKAFDAVKSCTKDIIMEGYAMGDLLMKIHDIVVAHKELNDLSKALICEKIAEVRRMICF